MPRLSLAVPKYRRYRPKNLAVVNFGRGRDVYLGPWKSRRSRELYDQLIALWLQNGRTLLNEVLADFCLDNSDVHVGPAAVSSSPTPCAPLDCRPEESTSSVTLGQLAEQYNAHAVTYYRKNGRTTREAEQVAEALGVAVGMFGDELAASFGPLRIQQVRDAMIQRGWSRPYINKQCGRIKLRIPLGGDSRTGHVCRLRGFTRG